MAKLDLATFDAVVLISGDGLIHEVFNGLARRPDGAAALRSLPIGCVPAGTSNGLWVSIAGPHDCKSLAFALLNVLKGEPLPMDLCLVSQASKPILYSFLTQAYGLLAECDLGTEHLRWMGGKRVYVGYAAGVLANKAYPCEIWAKIVSQDKQAIREDVKKGSHRTGMEPDTAELESMRSGSLDEPLEGQDGWTRLDMDSVAIFYAGKVVWSVHPGAANSSEGVWTGSTRA
jgi:sphingosine kinase